MSSMELIQAIQILTEGEIVEQLHSLISCEKEKEDWVYDTVENSGPSNDKVFHCLDIAMKWLDQWEECLLHNVAVNILKNTWDLTVGKCLSGIKQRKTNHFLWKW